MSSDSRAARTAATAPELLQVRNLVEFFRDSVDAAMAANRVAVERHTAHYIVNLLALFARSEVFHAEDHAGRGRRPLALMLADILEMPPGEERNALLRHLGDVALFVAGFLGDSLDRSPAGVGYYVRMGGGAYRSLAASLPETARGRAYAPVFSELGEKFPDLVDVLTEVRHAAGSARDEDVLRLYDLWLQTGSRRARRLLRRLGVEPSRQPGGVLTH